MSLFPCALIWAFMARLSFRLRVVDYQKSREIAEADQAAYVRLGRLLGAAVTDALSARFSCARSAGCSHPDRAAPSGDLRQLGSRLSMLVPLQTVSAAPGGAGPLGGAGRAGGPLALAAGQGLLARSGPGGFQGPGLQMSAFDQTGRFLDDLSYQLNPGSWFGVRNANQPSPWSLWFRTDYVSMVDTDPGWKQS